MPMFLPRERWSKWLDPDLRDVYTIRNLFENFKPDANLQFWPVSNLVNSIGNNGPELTSPVAIVPETLF